MRKLIEIEAYLNDIDVVIDKFTFHELKNSTLLITGGLGLIGGAIVDILARANQTHSLNMTILVGARNKNVFNEKYSSLKNIRFVQYDALMPITFKYDIDYIIHCASIASPEKYIKCPVETLNTNITGTQNLLEYAKNNNVKKLLFVSSSEIYGLKDDGLPFCENNLSTIDINNIRNSYSIGKVSAEMMCKAYASEYNLFGIIVRPGHIFGPSASPNDKKLSSNFAYLAAKGQCLELKSTGLQQRSYCYSLDCAAAILIALIHGQKGECYNIGHNETTSVYQLSKYLAKAGNVDLNYKQPTTEELKAFNPMDNSILDNSKIKAIGYSDTFNIETACAHTVKIIKESLKNEK